MLWLVPSLLLIAVAIVLVGALTSSLEVDGFGAALFAAFIMTCYWIARLAGFVRGNIYGRFQDHLLNISLSPIQHFSVSSTFRRSSHFCVTHFGQR